jgi:hypothetical protein
MPADDLERCVVRLTNPKGFKVSPIDLEQPLCGAKMKGFPLLHLLDALDKAPKQGLAAAWRATIPDRLRPVTERAAITSVAWLPIELYFHGVGFAAQALYGEGPRKAMRVGHQTASADIGAFFRMVLSLASPATVLGLSGRFWKSYFDVSKLAVIASNSNSCTAEITGWPLRDEVSWHEMAGSLVAWMEASRARDVQLTRFELVAPGHCVLDCSWR